MSETATFAAKRDALEVYFDRTAREAWERLTSDAPVSGIRATVRAGRDRMRATILSWLPADMNGLTLLDAGCGTGALAVEAAQRGASVVAVDVAGGLIDIARERAPRHMAIDWQAGDMLSEDLGRFDHIVAMDSLIHYRQTDMARAVERLASRSRRSTIFTFAPQTPALAAMHALGKLFPKGDRSPAIEPVAEHLLRDLLAAQTLGRSERVASGFYTSQALEVIAT